MKKYLIAILFLAMSNCVIGQLTTEDTSIMSKAINLFRSDLNANYWLVEKTYDNEYRERPEFVRAALNKLKTIKKLSSNSKLDILNAAKSFKKIEFQEFNHALKVAINSDEMNLLCGIHVVIAGGARDVYPSEQKKVKTREEVEREKLDFYKSYYRLEAIKALEISEPFFDSSMTNAIIVLTAYTHRIADTHLLLFKKENGLWKKSESFLVLSMIF